MGTRGFVGIVVNGTEHVTYNSMDSGPHWLGREVLADTGELLEAHSPLALRDLADRLWCPNPDNDFSGAPSIREAMATRPGFAAHVTAQTARGYAPRGKSLDDRDEDTWRFWTEFQGLAEMVSLGVYEANPHFPLYSGYCEWGYLLDLDRDNGPDRPPGVLEVYRGFQSIRPAAGRWAHRPTPAEEAADHDEHVAWCQERGMAPWLEREAPFKACAPVAVWALDSLPEQSAMDELHARSHAGTLAPLAETRAA